MKCGYCKTKLEKGRKYNHCPYCGTAFTHKDKIVENFKLITGGMDEDNNMSAKLDYITTINRMKDIFIDKAYESPFILVSNREVRKSASSGNHLSLTAPVQTMGGQIIIFDEPLFDEGKYIEGLEFIQEWCIDKEMEEYRLIMTNGEFEVRTGRLSL